MNNLQFVMLMVFITINSAIAVDRPNLRPSTFDGNCNCAMFRAEDNSKWDEPLLVSNPHIPMPHNIEGARSCLRICIALFVASGDNIGKVVCNVLQYADNLYVNVYFRLCQEEKWANTRSTSKNPICCRDSQQIDCKGR